MNQLSIFEFANELPGGGIHFRVDPETGMRAIIAIHSTKLGPSLGGCRYYAYGSERDAINDAVRLARGMSHKAALADLPLGGGKAVIMKPCQTSDRKKLFTAFGKFVNQLNGRYITAIDSGTSLSDMDIVAQQTKFVVNSIKVGDLAECNPSFYTTWGVLRGIEAAVKFKFGSTDLKSCRIAIQGVGDVGFYLAKLLHERGAQLVVCDHDQAKLQACQEQFQAQVVGAEEIYAAECDIFSPCAMGASINAQTIEHLKAKIIAGAANNQLAQAQDGETLRQLGILYAPDFVINAGGLMLAHAQYTHAQQDVVTAKVDNIAHTLAAIFMRAQAENLPTSLIAERLAEEKIATASATEFSIS